jgi:hypothetical protein
MTLVQFKIFTWDYKSQPDWEAITQYVHSIETRPYFYAIDTNSDSWGVMIADKELLKEEVELLAEED